MKASPDFCMRVLTRLRGRVALKADMKGIDLELQLADYASELTTYEPADVEAACLGWSRKSKWWPALAELIEAADEAKLKREHQRISHTRAQPGENFIQRCLRLGFHAGRMSTISHSGWKNIWEQSEPDRQHPVRWDPMTDEQVVQALQWCEEHPGMTWKPAKIPSTPEEIRHTAKLVFDIEASPESFSSGPALAKLGRTLIYRHIANGTCPPDVATFFPPEAEPAPP
jgi:hypothetical protein